MLHYNVYRFLFQHSLLLVVMSCCGLAQVKYDKCILDRDEICDIINYLAAG